MEQVRVIFEGMVQGVGFRFTALHAARSFDVSGFVRNLPDGTVEMVAEGEKRELEEFVGAVKTKMSHYIRDAFVQWGEPTGRFQGFDVRY